MHDSSLQTNFEKLTDNYHDNIGSTHCSHFFAPGRVNLICEYTDFHGGLVLPCAIQYGTYLIVQKNNKQSFSFHSINCPETPEVSFNTFQSLQEKQNEYAWANYPLGVLKSFESYINFSSNAGLDFYYYGNIPLGSGLSSSASIEVVTAFALKTLFNTQHSLTELALLCQKAENNFIGLKCGVMDPYSIAHGQFKQAMVIDCENITHQAIDINMGDLTWLIIDSKKPRQLSESKYNERNQECQTALHILNKKRNLKYLCQLPFHELALAKNEFNDSLIYQRMHHVVSEHHRVIECQQAIQAYNWALVAELMNTSHKSLSEDFDVSGETLDTLVRISQKTDGVLGARMTGAGFGGCTINLIETKKQESIIENIKKEYLSSTGRRAEFYIALASQGVHQFNGTN